MKTAPKLIVGVGKQLNFFFDLWGCRSHSERKHSQSLNSALCWGQNSLIPLPLLQAREEILKKLWRPHGWLFLALASSGVMNDFPAAGTMTGLFTLTEWKSDPSESVNCGVQVPFCCFARSSAQHFWSFSVFMTKPSKLASEPCLCTKTRPLRLVPKFVFFIMNCPSSVLHSLLKPC